LRMEFKSSVKGSSLVAPVKFVTVS
jgi:hypothetical protein